MTKSVGASAPAYVYSVSNAHCDGFEEARIRLDTASKAISTFCNLLANNGDQISIDPEGLYALLFPIEAEITAALDELNCAMMHKETA